MKVFAREGKTLSKNDKDITFSLAHTFWRTTKYFMLCSYRKTEFNSLLFNGSMCIKNIESRTQTHSRFLSATQVAWKMVSYLIWPNICPTYFLRCHQAEIPTPLLWVSDTLQSQHTHVSARPAFKRAGIKPERNPKAHKEEECWQPQKKALKHSPSMFLS